MGSEVGVFTDQEMEGLSKTDRALLRKHVLHHVQTASGILQIIRADPTVLTKSPQIRQKLRKAAGPLHKRLKRK
jgi:hypothetical protein